MPQMAPMWWTFLMSIYLLAMIMCMQMLYFNLNKMFYNKSEKKIKNFNWMW
uniref:ATP synthase F0 subunit 8 n=1 Tax=Eurhadina cuii TaxID=1287892 RepID=UPI0022DCDBBD|nr:ATP synthase F0 subunit 8 [Eurhadina cuii]UGN61488.1 ATP synthase F0 subunit 8 [Eurhadina cuii]